MHCKAINIKSVNQNGVARALVPVHSLEERATYKNAWFFRLASEMQDCVDKGWKIGFFTLTYDDEHLPYLPSSVFCNNQPFEPIQCFCRQDIRSFITAIRKWFYDTYNIKGVKYLVASELGEHTKRSHYHGLISWPSSVPAEIVHSAIKKFWSVPHKVRDPITHLMRTDYSEKLGFVFPRDPRGGRDSHGYMHKPFELEANPIAAARYASKYVCKDFAFLDSIRDKHILTKSREFRECSCFHVQSKSLGLSVLAKATDEQKLSWLKDGYYLAGQEKPVDIPIYIRNKILFDPYYIVDELGNRLVRRKATEFFNAHYEEIFDKKCDCMEKLFTKMMDVNWWRNNCNVLSSSPDDPLGLNAPNLAWSSYMRFLDKNSFDARSLARKYVSTFGLSPDNVCHVPAAKQWFSRYCEDNILAGAPRACVSDEAYETQIMFNKELELILGATRYFSDLAKKSDEQFNNKIQDYWKSMA